MQEIRNSETVCAKDKCVGCMSCVEACPVHAIKVEDTLKAYNASIDFNKCIQCGICRKLCQNNNELVLKTPLSWHQGWAKDDTIRAKSSSGGIAAALSYAFVKNEGIVCSCVFSDGAFKFEFADTVEKVKRFAGSKYVKSNPIGIYKKVKELIKAGKNVLFIGLPCQVAAIQRYVGEEYQENLYTVDLICHGTPSPRLLEDFLSQYNDELDNVRDIAFRSNNMFGLRYDGRNIVQPGAVDRYSLSFLCGLDYTENCYSCRFVGVKRGSDITLGDSWGSELLYEEKKKGISLILCQTAKGEALLKQSELVLCDVDVDLAVSMNPQLRAPVPKTKRHDRFFSIYQAGRFNWTVFRCLPKKCFLQLIKACLLKYGFLRRR